MEISGKTNIQPLKKPVKVSTFRSWKKWLLISGFYIMVSGMVLTGAYVFFQSPKEYALRKENRAYRQQLSALMNKIEKMETTLNEISVRDDSLYRVMYGLSPIPKEQRMVGYGGSDRYYNLRGYRNSDQIIYAAERLDNLGRKMYVEHKSLEKLAKKAELREKRLRSIPAIKPVSVLDFRYISSPYGFRFHPKTHRWKKHTGIDIVARYGTPVYATGDGVIKESFRDRYYGNMVIINHGFGYQTLYAHMRKAAVKKGDTVKRGQVIGYVGNTGLSTGTHLHYEVIKNGYRVNPKRFFSNDLSQSQYLQIVDAAKKRGK